VFNYYAEIHKDEDVRTKSFKGVTGFFTQRVWGGDSPDGPISTDVDGLKRLNQVKSLRKATIVIPGIVSAVHDLMALTSKEILTVILSLQDHFEVPTLVNPQVGYVIRKATREIGSLSFRSLTWKLKTLPTDEDFALVMSASEVAITLGGGTFYEPTDIPASF